jgi:hypothetical protein
VFNNELKLYEDEGIEVVVSSCPDNGECIELLSGRQVSEHYLALRSLHAAYCAVRLHSVAACSYHGSLHGQLLFDVRCPASS